MLTYYSIMYIILSNIIAIISERGEIEDRKIDRR